VDDHAADPEAALTAIPNVGPATAEDLVRLGVDSPDGLETADADELYKRLCELDGRRHDPCTRDVFAAAIAYVRDGVERPWWAFSHQRKPDDG
jgi:predicted flap endonuclease-1-like 5' DNA nuclease